MLIGAARHGTCATSQRLAGVLRSLLGDGIGAVALPAALLLAIVMGQRSSIGLFLSPMNSATGIVGAGGSAGQMIVAPLAQGAIAAVGWIGAMLMMAVMTLAVVPLARAFRGEAAMQSTKPGGAPRAARATTRRAALCDPLYWAVSGGFAICGFHVGFLTAHVPGVIQSCGLPPTLAGLWISIAGACNIVGSIVSGVLTQTRSMPHMLMALYAGRAAGMLLFVAAPKTPAVMLGFAVWMGTTYMATVPPTTGLLARRYGAGNLAALLAVAMLLHQSGSALGVWPGGVAFEASGGYDWFWSLDIGLALLAVVIHLPLLSGRRQIAAGGERTTKTSVLVRGTRFTDKNARFCGPR